MKKSIALAYRSGVPKRPSRSGSSPRHSRIVLTAPDNLCRRAAACSGDSSLRSRVPRPVQVNKDTDSITDILLLGRLSPSKSMTGLGERTSSKSNLGLVGEGSSRASRAGLLILCLLFGRAPLGFFCEDFDFLFLFVPSYRCPSSSDLRLLLPLGFSLSGETDFRLSISLPSCASVELSVLNWTLSWPPVSIQKWLFAT